MHHAGLPREPPHVQVDFKAGHITGWSTNVKPDDIPAGAIDLDAWKANEGGSRLKLVQPLLDGLFIGLSKADVVGILGRPDEGDSDLIWLVGHGMADDWMLVACIDEAGCVASASDMLN